MSPSQAVCDRGLEPEAFDSDPAANVFLVVICQPPGDAVRAALEERDLRASDPVCPGCRPGPVARAHKLVAKEELAEAASCGLTPAAVGPGLARGR